MVRVRRSGGAVMVRRGCHVGMGLCTEPAHLLPCRRPDEEHPSGRQERQQLQGHALAGLVS